MPVSNRERSRLSAIAARTVLSAAGYPVTPHTEPYTTVVRTDTGALLVKCTYNPAIDQHVVAARFADRAVAAQERKRPYAAKLDHRAETAEAATGKLLDALKRAGHRPKGTTPTPTGTPAQSLTALLDANHGRVMADTIPRRDATMLRVWAAGQDEHGHVIRDVTDEVADVLGLRMEGLYLRLPGAGFVPTWELGRLLDERLTLRHKVSFL
jgi:hypothetical protein